MWRFWYLSRRFKLDVRLLADKINLDKLRIPPKYLYEANWVLCEVDKSESQVWWKGQKLFQEESKLGSRRGADKSTKKLQKYFHDSSNFASGQLFLAGYSAVTNTPPKVVPCYQRKQCVPFHKRGRQGACNIFLMLWQRWW